MKETLLTFYGYFVFFYSLSLIISYLFLMWMSYKSLRRNKNARLESYVQNIIEQSPYTPGISIIAPAYNEEQTIIANVHSLLQMDYPRFEVVIVNDGSKDKTLEKLIEEFHLVEVPFAYVESIKTHPFKRCFKSSSPDYSSLLVVDKENGKTKADAANAGINASSYPYFICTDADCILETDALRNCILPVLNDKDIIAVSGCMNMVNGCKVEAGRIAKNRPPHSPLPLFQTLEYLRSFLIGKQGWSGINAMPNVSGGFGLFNHRIAVEAGGYKSDSLAEDEELMIRMIGYCCDFNLPYRIVQIPDNCCWTEAPATLRLFYRQRVRWGHGLFQTLFLYRRMFFNRHYRHLGMITLPYQFLFEFAAPFIELSGFITFLYLALTGGVNWMGAAVIFGAIYTFSLLLNATVIYFDYMKGCSYTHKRSYSWLILATFLEPFFYHPFLVLFALTGYWKFVTSQGIHWGEMTRKGFNKPTNPQP